MDAQNRVDELARKAERFVGIHRELSSADKNNLTLAIERMNSLPYRIMDVVHALELVEFAEAQLQHYAGERTRLREAEKDARAQLRLPVEALAKINEETARIRVIEQRMRSWKGMAQKEIPMLLDDFHKTLGLSKTHFERINSLRLRQDRRGMSSAMKQFGQSFPGHGDMRNAAAHPVDYSGKADDFERNSVRGPIDKVMPAANAQILLTQCTFGNALTYTSEGKLLTLVLDRSIVDKLFDITGNFYDACALRPIT
jgi:hypothetical protein